MKTETTTVSPEGCILDKFEVHSPSMGREIKAVVVLPPEYKDHPEKKYPVLHTFHGAEAPYDTFSAMVPLRQALAGKPMIVTCFDADAWSAYLDSPFPLKRGREPEKEMLVKSLFTTFFFEEFIPHIDRHYRVDDAKRMLTGFSMGGFGAFHYLLTKPERFVSVSSLSGWFESWRSLPDDRRLWVESLIGPYEGNEGLYAALDLYGGIKRQKNNGVKFPPLYLHCGTEDFLLEANRTMSAFLKEQGIDCEYLETPGDHTWPFWRDASVGVIDFHWRTLLNK
jgi:S-formylglutathione hydrolase FrmB